MNRRFYIHFPMLILLMEWVFVIFLHYKNPFNFIVMSNDTLNIILIGLAFIVIGYYFVDSFYIKSHDTPEIITQKIELNERFWGRFILFLSFFITIGLILVLKEIAKITNNFKLYIENPFIVREILVNIHDISSENLSMSSYRIGSYFCSLMYPASVLGGIMMTQRSKWRLTGLIPLLLVVFHSLININRFGLITSVAIWLISMLYFGIFLDAKRKKEYYVNMLIYFIIISSTIVAVFYIVLRMRAFYMNDIDYLIKRSLYSYISGPGSAFEKFNFDNVNLQYGVSSFRSIVKWISRVGLISKELIMGTHSSFKNISYGNPMWINTYTFAKAPYEDFGILGVGIISLIWGMLGRQVIERFLNKFSLINIFMVSIFIMSLLMSFYEFYFEGLSVVVYWALIIVLIEMYIHKNNAVSYAKL